jgi:hypothetical protein
METQQILKNARDSIKSKKYIHLTEAEYSQLDDKLMNLLLAEFAGKYMIRLPEAEIDFFEWVKTNDYAVWNDIWNDLYIEENDEVAAETNSHSEYVAADVPYLVSIDLLPLLLNKDGRGFPICDLQTTDNYFFTMDNMVDEESKLLIEAVRELFWKNEQMTVGQMLALEISLEPIDIWHFAYKYKLDINTAKSAVKTLVDDNVLVHLCEAEYVAPFIHF